MPVSKVALKRVSQRIADHAGLHPPEWVLEARIEQRISALELPRPDSYASLLDGPQGADELSRLIETLRVGETRFFRHKGHVEAVQRTVVPDLTRLKDGGRIRAWSAGCATGEEAYTLAIILSRGLRSPPYQLSVLGSDISSDALEKARLATYDRRAIDFVPASIREASFTRTGDRFEVTPKLRRLVSFEKRNLADGGFPGAMHLIFCRNVLIYFTPEARQDVVTRLIASLEPGGYLFVGYSESLRDFEQLEVVPSGDSVVYRKPERAHAQVSVPRSEQVSAAKRPEPAAAPAPRTAVLRLSGRYETAERLTDELGRFLTNDNTHVTIELDGAEYLGDEAGSVLRRACSAARAAGTRVTVVAERQSTKRWLARARLEEDNP